MNMTKKKKEQMQDKLFVRDVSSHLAHYTHLFENTEPISGLALREWTVMLIFMILASDMVEIRKNHFN